MAVRQHEVLADSQIFDDAELGPSWVAPLEIHHEARQNTAHGAAARERAVCDGAHRAADSAAVNDAEAALGKHLADAARRLVVDRVATAARSAVHADRLVHGAS